MRVGHRRPSCSPEAAHDACSQCSSTIRTLLILAEFGVDSADAHLARLRHGPERRAGPRLMRLLHAPQQQGRRLPPAHDP